MLFSPSSKHLHVIQSLICSWALFTSCKYCNAIHSDADVSSAQTVRIRWGFNHMGCKQEGLWSICFTCWGEKRYYSQKPEFDKEELKSWVSAAGFIHVHHIRWGRICWRYLESGLVKQDGGARPGPGVPSRFQVNCKYESEERWEFWAWTRRSWNGDGQVERVSNFDQDWVPNATAEQQAPPSAGDPTVHKEGGTKQRRRYTEGWVTPLGWVVDKQCFIGMILLFLCFPLIFHTCHPSVEFVSFLIFSKAENSPRHPAPTPSTNRNVACQHVR